MNSAIYDKESDQELSRLVAAGDEAAFARLVDRYQRAVFSTIRRYLGSSTDVEDLAQDVFASVWQNARRFEGRSKFSTWLYRIVVNRCLKHRRKHRIAVESLDEQSEEARVPEQLSVEFNQRLEQERKSRIVNQAISELPERQRLAVRGERFVEPLELLERVAAIVQRFGKVGLDLQRTLVVVQRGLEAFEIFEDIAVIVVCIRLAWVYLNDASQQACRLIQTSRLGSNDPQQV
jgi:RNA polymerase sigma factor (sigma-70 family)